MKATPTHATSHKTQPNSLRMNAESVTNQRPTKQAKKPPTAETVLKMINKIIGRLPKEEQAEALESLLILLLKNN